LILPFLSTVVTVGALRRAPEPEVQISQGESSFSGWSSMNKGGSVSGMWLLGVLAGVFVLENLDRIDDFAKIFGGCVGESTMMTLCKELMNLLKVVEDHV